jgi:hypothetical protein
MRTVYILLVAIALMGMASAVELSNSNLSLSIFHAYMEEDLVPSVSAFQPVVDAWNGSQNKVIGAFDYSEVADMTNSLGMGDLVRVGNMSDGEGHYLDGTKNYIQP